MTPEHVAAWHRAHLLKPIHVDCATTVMLKILDGKCKMNPEEKIVMALLYDEVKHLPGKLLQSELHRLIADSRGKTDAQTRSHIYEMRLFAETTLGRPTMKAFKAMIRQQGLFDTSEEIENQ